MYPVIWGEGFFDWKTVSFEELEKEKIKAAFAFKSFAESWRDYRIELNDLQLENITVLKHFVWILCHCWVAELHDARSTTHPETSSPEVWTLEGADSASSFVLFCFALSENRRRELLSTWVHIPPELLRGPMTFPIGERRRKEKVPSHLKWSWVSIHRSSLFPLSLVSEGGGEFSKPDSYHTEFPSLGNALWREFK